VSGALCRNVARCAPEARILGKIAIFGMASAPCVLAAKMEGSFIMAHLTRLTASLVAACTIGFSGMAAAQDIVDTAVKVGSFNTLAAALKAADLVDTLKGDGPFTVFAPTDEAFAKLPAGTVETLLKPENKEKLAAILTYHVAAEKLDAKAVTTQSFITTVNGQRVSVSTTNGATLDNATVTATDIAASNGIIHVIDSVLIPTDATIAQVATEAGSFKTLLTALQATGLDAAVAGPGNFTVFAPTDEAFAKLPAGTVETLLRPENKEQLAAILKYHVLDTTVFSTDLAPAQDVATLAGETLNITAAKAGVTVNGAKVTGANIRASNGVVHVIDSVLLPPAKKETSSKARRSMDVINVALDRGVTMYNHGNPAACAAIYEVAATALLTNDSAMCSATRAGLERAMESASHEHDASERAWILRRGLDDVAHSLNRSMTASPMMASR